MKFKNTHLLMLCIVAFFSMAGGALLSPVLPEMVEPLHATSQDVGLLISAYTISTAIFALVIGHFIDRVNRKKLLVPCLVLYGLTGLVSYFTSDLQSLLLLRFIQGIGVAGMTSLPMLIIADVYKGHKSLYAMNKISMAFAIGSVSAPLIGGGLASLGWNYPFLFYVLSLPFAFVVIVLLPETRIKRDSDEHKGIFNGFTALKELRISYTVFLSFAIFFILYSALTYTPFMLNNVLGYTAKEAGIVLAFQGIAVIFIVPRVKILASKYSTMLIIATGFTLTGLAIFSVSFAYSIFTVLLLMLLFGAGFGLAQTAIDAQIVQIAPSESKGGVLSIYNTMKYVGQSLSPIVLGIVLLNFDLATVFRIAGFFGLLVALITYLMKNIFENSGDEHIKEKETKISVSHQ
ncbi:multidrug-efflux transporter [Methanosarcina lacustris Z-7289]|uniref:Multidrug-efflux transporter n=1 Tax=Methanosarcina lacustris Z-7289 TaxID=1434111 RepID=A0A0E3S6T9_9EURY|nr:MFS transporter [Methanosarcina lacustris]AKB75042.1 multidrug-efflux transporter [Methanosarcina lacustris Z-7289]